MRDCKPLADRVREDPHHLQHVENGLHCDSLVRALLEACPDAAKTIAAEDSEKILVMHLFQIPMIILSLFAMRLLVHLAQEEKLSLRI